MVAFAQPQDPSQDPDAIKKALLAKLFGSGPIPAPGATPAAPGTAQPISLPGTPPALSPPATTQPNASSPPATPLSTAPAAQPAKPIMPGDQSTNPILSAEEFAKQNPAAPHTPYQAPDFKHRLLMGIFAGMQQFGRDPAAGQRMLSQYAGDIDKKTEEEKNYPLTSANTAKAKYGDYLAGQKGPLDLEDLKSQITERQAHARDLDAQAKARANPTGKAQHLVVEDPAHPGQPKSAYFDEAKRAYIDPDTQQPIVGAKPFEQQGKQPPTVKYDSGIPTEVTADGKTYSIHDPNLPPELKPIVDSATAAHNQFLNEQADREARAAARNKGKSEQNRSEKSADVLERETRTNIRKAQQTYRSAEATSNMQREFIKEAKGGNKAAVKIVPLEGALEITTSQGVHRINRTEVEQYGGAGSLMDRIRGKIGKGLSGQDIPDDVLDDMDKMTQEVEKNAYERYNAEYDDEIGIAKNNGLDKIEQHLPRIKQHTPGGNASGAPAAAAGGAAALPPGWK